MIHSSEITHDTPILTVRELNQTARALLENTFALAWVKGELSGVKLHHSGHLYFTLKDPHAQVKGVMFRASNRRLEFTPEDGLEVLVRGTVTLYEQGGSYQLNATHMEKSGLGPLQQAFEALKATLQAEGLFDPSRKKLLPRYPQHIGIITSHTGAALQDILSVLKRRYPIAPVTVYHTQVQGKAATNEIVHAIKYANEHNVADVLILARGGGSLEDLWCFNEAAVARAIAQSHLPIITGVGHEVDFTIADFVADHRAPTPSAAAETVVPDSIEIVRLFTHWRDRLTQTMQRIIQHLSMQIDHLEKRLISPTQRLTQYSQSCEHFRQKLVWMMTRQIQIAHSALAQASRQLHAVSPLATLERGYTIVTDPKTQQIVRSVTSLRTGQQIETRFVDGTVYSVVTMNEK